MSKLSNFDFLKDYDETLWKLGNRIEKQVNFSPSGVKADATTFLEHILKKLLTQAGLKYNSRKTFTEQVDAVFRSPLKMSNAYRERIKSAYNYRNKIHDDFENIEKHEYQDALQLHEKLFYIVRKLYRDYNDDYDEYKGVPEYKPLEIDFSNSEVEQIKVPDFNEIIDIKYDYCIVCGEPNHLNYSIYCHKCSRVIDNANNFISIRNRYGKNAKFTKEELIEDGMPEGYVNQFINSMVREDMLNVSGRYITFNNMHLDEYLSKIDDYISVGELITRFKEDKISPADIKKSREYILGSRKDEHFYQFYKIVNREIIKKFEKDILTTEDIKRSIEYTAITEKHLQRWYLIQLNNYNKGIVNESFVVFNDLLKRRYIDMKREGILESEIRRDLNVTDRIYEFWSKNDKDFQNELKQIKIDLIIRAITEGKTRAEIIEFAGVTPKEYDNLIKVSKFKGDDLAQVRNKEIESRKENFVNYLKSNDLESSCRLAKFSLDDFYEYYDTADVDSKFYKDSTKILMDKYLAQRRLGKSRQESIKIVEIKEKYVNRWFSRSRYADFKDADLKVTVDLILKGFKRNKSLEEISKTACVSVDAIKSYIQLGKRGSKIYRPLFEHYENEIIPQKLHHFLHVTQTRSVRRAMDSSKLTEEELSRYYKLGKAGDERFTEFYDEFFDIKKGTYIHNIEKGRTHNIALKESHLTQEEYLECKDELDEMLRIIKINIVLETVKAHKTSNVAASKAGCSVDEIYEWYFRGRDGEEEFANFYDAFHKLYVNASVVPIQEKLDSERVNIDILIKSNRDKFTKKDFDIWVKNGLINIDVVHMDSEDNENDDDDEDCDKKVVKKVNIGNKVKNPNSNRSSLGRLEDNDYDVEELKKQILKK